MFNSKLNRDSKSPSPTQMVSTPNSPVNVTRKRKADDNPLTDSKQKRPAKTTEPFFPTIEHLEDMFKQDIELVRNHKSTVTKASVSHQKQEDKKLPAKSQEQLSDKEIHPLDVIPFDKLMGALHEEINEVESLNPTVAKTSVSHQEQEDKKLPVKSQKQLSNQHSLLRQEPSVPTVEDLYNVMKDEVYFIKNSNPTVAKVSVPHQEQEDKKLPANPQGQLGDKGVHLLDVIPFDELKSGLPEGIKEDDSFAELQTINKATSLIKSEKSEMLLKKNLFSEFKRGYVDASKNSKMGGKTSDDIKKKSTANFSKKRQEKQKKDVNHEFDKALAYTHGHGFFHSKKNNRTKQELKAGFEQFLKDLKEGKFF